jgi:hypothetical protein
MQRLGLTGKLLGRLAINLTGKNISGSDGVIFNVTKMGQSLEFLILCQNAFQIVGKFLILRRLDIDFRCFASHDKVLRNKGVQRHRANGSRLYRKVRNPPLTFSG